MAGEAVRAVATRCGASAAASSRGLVVRERLRDRLDELHAERQAGRKALASLEAEQVELRDTLLRIGGAIQVLEELLGADRPDLPARPDTPVTTVTPDTSSVPSRPVNAPTGNGDAGGLAGSGVR